MQKRYCLISNYKLIHTSASIILVLATSMGVVIAAAINPKGGEKNL